jgi:hypothetical protein
VHLSKAPSHCHLVVADVSFFGRASQEPPSLDSGRWLGMEVEFIVYQIEWGTCDCTEQNNRILALFLPTKSTTSTPMVLQDLDGESMSYKP